LRQDVAGLRQSLASLTRRVDVLEDRVRANGVLLEAIRDDVRQIAEAHVLLAQRVADYRSESDSQRQILSLLQTSYRDLDRRLTRLEERAGEPGSSRRP
jgi:chromosome segregation ATPase